MDDTPNLARAYCPGCEPDADPIAEILQTHYCEYHQPVRDGAEDDKVNAAAYLSGTADAGGEDNARMNNLLMGRIA